MSGLVQTMAAISGESFRIVYGKAYWDGGKWWADVGGSLLDARWIDPIQPLQNGNIAVAIFSDGRGQSSALVLGGYTDQPRPGAGAVLAVGITEVVFTGEDGGSYTTDRFVGSYSPGDLVLLDWAAGKPTIVGVVPAITVTPPLAPPPAPDIGGSSSGLATLVATASDTFGVGGWGRWATSQNGGEDVYTGTQGGFTVTGSWFYGAQGSAVGGSVTRVRFRVPARLPAVGNYNSAVTVRFYAHTSPSRPGGDVTRTVGPFDLSVPVGHGGGWVDLPLDFGPVLAAGGGISIAGGDYTGFHSRLDDPESGKALLDWSA